jgi:hypothetical protein
MRQWMKIYRSWPIAIGNGTMYFPIKLGTLLSNICQLKTFPTMFGIWPWIFFSYFQVLVIYLFPIQPTKLELGLQIGGKLPEPIKLTSQSETWSSQ